MKAIVYCALLAYIVTQISCDDNNETKKEEAKAESHKHYHVTGQRCGEYPNRCGGHRGCATRAFVRCPYAGHRHIRVHAPGPQKPQVHYMRGHHPHHVDVQCPRQGPNHIIVQPARPQKPHITFHGHGSYDKSYYFSPHGDGHHDSGSYHHGHGGHSHHSGHYHHHHSCSCSSDASHSYHYSSSSSESCSDSHSKQNSIHIHYDHGKCKHGRHNDGTHRAIEAWKLLEKKEDEVEKPNTEIKALKMKSKNEKNEKIKNDVVTDKAKHESIHKPTSKKNSDNNKQEAKNSSQQKGKKSGQVVSELQNVSTSNSNKSPEKNSSTSKSNKSPEKNSSNSKSQSNESNNNSTSISVGN